MSGIETTPMPQDLTAYAGNASRYLLPNLPTELLIQIMKFLPDMAALSRLFTAYPTTVTSFIESRNKIFASILSNMSSELRNASLDVLAVRSRPPIHPSQITHFIEYYLDAEAYDAQLSEGIYSLDALLDLIAVAGSLESLTESFAWQRVIGPSMQHEMPLSPVELHRIQRSLWHFQLCCDLCHPETSVSSSQESHNAQSRSTRRNIQHQTSQPTTPNVPNWLHCRGEPHRPEALSRFLPNLCAWERDELSAIRFHILQLVNRIQYLRSCSAETQSNEHPPLLLLRLIRDIDAWDPRKPTDHLLLASFAQGSAHGYGRGVKQYPAVWGRRREMYAASVPNSARRFAIRAMQGGMEQWGWCVWDEERLVRRGLIDPVLEGLVEVERGGSGDMYHGDGDGGGDDGDNGGVKEEKEEEKEEREEEQGPSKSKIKKRIQERRERVRRAHWECVGAQYEGIDWRVAALFESYRRVRAERMRGEIGDRG